MTSIQVETEPEALAQQLEQLVTENANWVTDGNYFKHRHIFWSQANNLICAALTLQSAIRSGSLNGFDRARLSDIHCVLAHSEKNAQKMVDRRNVVWNELRRKLARNLVLAQVDLVVS